MKKAILLAMAAVFTSISAFAAHPTTAISDTTKTKKVKPVVKPATVQYTCPMHPEVLSDKPGKCPKCGMELVKKEPAKKKS
ncbi:MAG: hypothetical protein JWP78_1306 [Mucilaginibacter sp.]|nr:hypothetical protein [Mucilaginibacter sp.]